VSSMESSSSSPPPPPAATATASSDNKRRTSKRKVKNNHYTSEDDDLFVELQHETTANIFRTANEIVKDKLRGLEFLTEDYTSFENIPKVHAKEMSLGKVLGQGSFCTVKEIEKLKTHAIVGDIKKENKFGFFSSAVDKIREKRANRQNKFSKRSGNGDYVIKRLSPALARGDKIKLLEGSVDLAMEAKFLSSCDHANIISLAGMSSGGLCSEEFFLVLEKLTELLPDRIRYWSYQLRLAEGINGFFGRKVKVQEDMLVDRLEVALQVALGVAYLHSKQILFRDLVSCSIPDFNIFLESLADWNQVMSIHALY
jgi:hypothetical protein